MLNQFPTTCATFHSQMQGYQERQLNTVKVILQTFIMARM